MKVIKAFPPNYTEIAKVFPVAGKPGILYAWGDKLYNPSGVQVSPWLMAHEETHGRQQQAVDIPLWWRRYIDDPWFRLDQEIEAHRKEWQEYLDLMQGANPKHVNQYLDLIASRLSSPLYGNLITFDRAVEEINGNPDLARRT